MYGQGYGSGYGRYGGGLGFHPRDPDRTKGARFDWPTVVRAWHFVRPHRRRLGVYLLGLVATSGLGVVPPLLLRALLDQAIPHSSIRQVEVLVGVLATVQVLAAVIRVAGTWLGSKVAAGVVYDLRVELFDHLQRMPVSFFTRTQTGSVLTRILTDVNTAQNLFTGNLATFISDILVLAFALVAMLALSWQVTAVLLIGVPVALIPSKWMGRHLMRLSRRQMEANAAMSSVAAERFNVAGAVVVKLFGNYSRERRGFEGRAAVVRDLGIRQALYRAAFGATVGMLGILGTAAVYWLGARAVIAHTLTVGTIVALAAYVAQIYGPLLDLTNARLDVMTSLVAFDRVFEVLDAPVGITDALDALPLLAPSGHIEAEAVTFRYPPDIAPIPSLETESPGGGRGGQPDWVLRGIGFTVQPGTMTALVGPSGAGKSTLCNLVARLYEVTAGTIRIDGFDIAQLTFESLAAAIGMVTQDVHLFHDTAAANLRYARPEATDEELVAACRAAHIHDLIASLPAGYETVVGERGYRFSGGEKQRLAIARVLLKDPAIVILDEATAHLDSETESLVQQALRNALRGRSALVIAHRLSTVRAAEQILVLDGGRIVERGTHDELVVSGGLYADLYRTQFAAS
ncbi:MAG: ABC transporter ATP-binding protein [Acidimicrobiales bacterium]